jgi:hypothetical protein
MRFWALIVCDNVLSPEITDACKEIPYCGGIQGIGTELTPDPEYQCGDPPLFEGTEFISDNWDVLRYLWCECGNPGTATPPLWTVNIVLLW